MKITSTDLDALLFCSFRYALGRRTYVTELVASLLQKYKSSLQPFTKLAIIKEIKSALENNEAGMEMDRIEWKKVLEELK